MRIEGVSVTSRGAEVRPDNDHPESPGLKRFSAERHCSQLLGIDRSLMPYIMFLILLVVVVRLLFYG